MVLDIFLFISKFLSSVIISSVNNFIFSEILIFLLIDCFIYILYILVNISIDDISSNKSPIPSIYALFLNS